MIYRYCLIVIVIILHDPDPSFQIFVGEYIFLFFLLNLYLFIAFA